MSQQKQPPDLGVASQQKQLDDEEPLRYALGMLFLSIATLPSTAMYYLKKGAKEGISAAKFLAYAAVVYGVYLLVTYGLQYAVNRVVDSAIERVEQQDTISDAAAAVGGVLIILAAGYAAYRVVVWAVEPFKPIIAIADARTGDRTPDLSEWA